MDEGSTNSITFFEARPLPPPAWRPRVSGGLRAQFCHFIFPDLDVEDLAAKGLIEADLFGTPRLIGDFVICYCQSGRGTDGAAKKYLAASSNGQAGPEQTQPYH